MISKRLFYSLVLLFIFSNSFSQNIEDKYIDLNSYYEFKVLKINSVNDAYVIEFENVGDVEDEETLTIIVVSLKGKRKGCPKIKVGKTYKLKILPYSKDSLLNSFIYSMDNLYHSVLVGGELLSVTSDRIVYPDVFFSPNLDGRYYINQESLEQFEKENKLFVKEVQLFVYDFIKSICFKEDSVFSELIDKKILTESINKQLQDIDMNLDENNLADSFFYRLFSSDSLSTEVLNKHKEALSINDVDIEILDITEDIITVRAVWKSYFEENKKSIVLTLKNTDSTFKIFGIHILSF